MHKHIIGGVLVVSVLLMAIPAFADNASPTPTPVPVADKIACVGKAVATREGSLGSAIGTYNDAAKAAYSARADALSKAYALTTAQDVRTAVRAAWTAFSLALKDAGKAWRTAQNAAWQQYTKDVRVCKAPGSISDSARWGFEMMGK